MSLGKEEHVRLFVWSLFVSWLISLQNVWPNYSEISEVICLVSVRLLVDLPSERVAELLRDNAEACALLPCLLCCFMCFYVYHFRIGWLPFLTYSWMFGVL